MGQSKHDSTSTARRGWGRPAIHTRGRSGLAQSRLAGNGNGGRREPMVRQRVRIRFSKQGDLRWIGHRDLLRCMERWFRRASLPLGFSEGFHPKPRMMFPLALAVGIAADEEVMELELSEPLPADEVRQRLTRHALPGLEVRSVETLPEGAKKARARSVRYAAEMPADCLAGLPAQIEALLASSSLPIQRAAGRGPVDLRPMVEELSLHDGVLQMRLAVGDGPSAGPREVLAALGVADAERRGACLTRTAMEVET
jgi:radical SAM-linked protein